MQNSFAIDLILRKSTCLTILESPESIRTCFSSENGELWLPSECERWKGRQTSQCPQAPAQQIHRRVWFLLLFWRNWDIKVRNWCLHACVPDLLPHERSVIYCITLKWISGRGWILKKKKILVTVKTQNHFYLCKKSNPKHSVVPFNFFFCFFLVASDYYLSWSFCSWYVHKSCSNFSTM